MGPETSKKLTTQKRGPGGRTKIKTYTLWSRIRPYFFKNVLLVALSEFCKKDANCKGPEASKHVKKRVNA